MNDSFLTSASTLGQDVHPVEPTFIGSARLQHNGTRAAPMDSA